MGLTLADGVSLSRLLLLAPWAWLYGSGSGWALAVMAAIIATDLVDGPLARRLQGAGTRGQLVDAGCDAAVVVAAAVVVGLKDARFLLLSGLAAACFVCWGARSTRVGFACYTRLGRYNGTACYLLLLLISGGPLFPAGFALWKIVEWVAVCGVGLLLGASTVENLIALGRGPERGIRNSIGTTAEGSREREG